MESQHCRWIWVENRTVTKLSDHCKAWSRSRSKQIAIKRFELLRDHVGVKTSSARSDGVKGPYTVTAYYFAFKDNETLATWSTNSTVYDQRRM